MIKNPSYEKVALLCISVSVSKFVFGLIPVHF